MASSTEIGVTGLAELERQLLRLETEVAGKAVRGSLSFAARPMRDRARELAPRDTGNLSEQIQMRSELGGAQRRVAATVHVLVRQRRGFYGALVEFGARQMPAQPFMRPAFDATAPEAVERFRASLARRIKRAMKRKASKA